MGRKRKRQSLGVSALMNELALTAAFCLVLGSILYYFAIYIPQIQKALIVDIEINNILLAKKGFPLPSASQEQTTQYQYSTRQLSQRAVLRSDVTYVGVYGRLRGWGSLGLVNSGEAAVEKSVQYAKQFDRWNGPLGVVPVVNLVQRGTSKVAILAAIRSCQVKGCYVMLDISPQQNVKNIIKTYTVAPNVWFDLDLEHNIGGKVPSTLFNSYVAYYAQLREDRGFAGPGVFGFYDFKSHIAPISGIAWSQGSVVVVPIFDGFAAKGGKWSGTKAHYQRYAKAHALGIMEFITRWGSKYDSGFTPAQYYQSFRPHFFIAQ